jgi:hypothetical protein
MSPCYRFLDESTVWLKKRKAPFFSQRGFLMNQRISVGIVWDDAWHRIEIQGCFLNLSPTQYRILHVFAESLPSTLPASDEMIILAYRSRGKLEAETELSRASLARHICDLNARLQTQGLHLSFFQAGYILTLASRQRGTPFGENFLSREGKIR